MVIRPEFPKSAISFQEFKNDTRVNIKRPGAGSDGIPRIQTLTMIFIPSIFTAKVSGY